MTDAQAALARYTELVVDGAEPDSPVERLRAFCSLAMSGQDWLDVEPFFDAILAHVEAQEAENERLRAALKTCVWALRQPLDGWKGECERKALDKARDALKEQR